MKFESRLSNDILNYLLELKNKKYPDITFHTRSNKKNQRFKEGVWFQGNKDYIFIGLVKPGGANRVKDIGLVFKFKNNSINKIYIEIIYYTNTDERFKKCYEEIAYKFDDIEKIERKNSKHFKKYLPLENGIDNLKLFYNNYWNLIKETIINNDLEKDLLIDEKLFQKKLNIIRDSKNDDSKVGDNISKKTILIDKNTILYGPPGTGKTYEIINDYLPKYTKIEKQNFEEFCRELIDENKLSYWKILALILYEHERLSVNDIFDEPLFKAKIKNSSNTVPKPTIWSNLQAHTKEECTNCNVADKSNPLIFWKNDDSTFFS